MVVRSEHTGPLLQPAAEPTGFPDGPGKGPLQCSRNDMFWKSTELRQSRAFLLLALGVYEEWRDSSDYLLN